MSEGVGHWGAGRGLQCSACRDRGRCALRYAALHWLLPQWSPDSLNALVIDFEANGGWLWLLKPLLTVEMPRLKTATASKAVAPSLAPSLRIFVHRATHHGIYLVSRSLSAPPTPNPLLGS